MPFIKGHIGYNKGLKLEGEYRNCLRCQKEVWIVKSRILKGGGRFCSRDCSNKTNAKRGKECWNYKEKVGYFGVHDWLKRNFGKAIRCEKCRSKKNVQWAKLKGKTYERIRENFWQLCVHCHLDYDGTSIVNRPTWNKNRAWTLEEREKISIGTKKGMAKIRQKI